MDVSTRCIDAPPDVAAAERLEQAAERLALLLPPRKVFDARITRVV